MNQDFWQMIVRRIIGIACTALATHGFISKDLPDNTAWIETTSSMVVYAGMVWWSSRQQKAIKAKAVVETVTKAVEAVKEVATPDGGNFLQAKIESKINEKSEKLVS